LLINLAYDFPDQFKAWLEAPIKLTTSGRGKLTTCFAGEDLVVQVCQC